MYTKSPTEIIHRLKDLVKKHARCIDQVIAQSQRDGDTSGNQTLIKRYVRDHKLLSGELAMQLKGLGAVPEQGTGGRPERMVQPPPLDKVLTQMMVELDRDVEMGYLSMLRTWPLPDPVEDMAVLHIAFLRRMQLYIRDYRGTIAIEDPDMRSPVPTAKARLEDTRPIPRPAFSRGATGGARGSRIQMDDPYTKRRGSKYPG